MHPSLKTLIELQEKDREIADLSLQLEQFPKTIQALEKELTDFINAHHEREQRLAASQKERRDLEGEIQLGRQKISKHRDQLFQVKTNEQYRAMLKEIEGEELNIRSVEDRILEKMIESDELQKHVKEAAARLDQEKARVAEDRSRIESLAAKVTGERDEYSKRRAELAGQLDSSVLATYERIRRGRGGIALAEVRNGKCMGCHVILRPQLYTDVRAGEALHECENCARILYSADALPVAAGSADNSAVA